MYVLRHPLTYDVFFVLAIVESNCVCSTATIYVDIHVDMYVSGVGEESVVIMKKKIPRG